MQAEDKFSQIKSWFKQKPRIPWNSIVIALLLVIIGVNTELWFLIAGLALGGIRIFMYVRAKSEYNALSSLTSQMSEWLAENIESLKERSLDAVGLDESETIAESIPIIGPVYWPINGLNDDAIRRRETEPDVYFYSVWGITILHIGENSIAVYRCDYNWPEDKPINVVTEEYFYRDIVAVRIGPGSITYRLFKSVTEKTGCLLIDFKKLFSDSKDEPEEIEITDGDIFEISMSSGEVLRILINSSELSPRDAEELSSRGQKAAQSIRRLLREKK